MSYAVCRMQKVKSAGLKGMQFHNQRERKSRTNDDIDHERTRENYDLKNDKNIDYNERVKEIIESQKTGTRKTRKDAVLDDDTVPKTVLTEEQEEKLLAFAKADKTYSKNYDEILILLKTGLRISEFGGLTLPDLDFENRLVNIDHQLLRDTEIGYYIETPKTKSGERQVPMVEEAYQAFKRVLANRKNDKRVEIDGYSDFLFLNRKNYPKVASDYNGMMKGLVKKYNKYNEDKLPHITPHSLRHTFCTNYANAGMNPKALQYIMGHANIAMTLNYYAHATFDSAMAEMKRLNKEKQQERLVA